MVNRNGVRKSILLCWLRNKDLGVHPLNIIDINMYQAGIADRYEIPTIQKKLSIGHILQKAAPPPLTEVFDFVTGISKFALVTEAGAQTETHIDCTGSCVMYTVLWGEKVFYVMDPTEKNCYLLDIFESLPTTVQK